MLNNNKDQFKTWVTSNHTENSGAASAYITSIEWLSKKFFENGLIPTSSIFEINNIESIVYLYNETKKIQKDKTSIIYNKDAPSYGEKNFYSASLGKYRDFLMQHKKTTNNNITPPFVLEHFLESNENCGLRFNKNQITKFTASLLTKPFVILTGLSGSGKTKLAQAFVKWICEREEQYRIVPVGADWTNRDPLLGYTNALKPEEYVKPDNKALDLILDALENPELPYFLILDEMNLSHVERYFADFLSTMESKEAIPLHANEMSDNKVPGKLDFPPNLFIIGTVNIDETTNMFSPKVLDRANTIEFRVTKDEMGEFLENIKDINMAALTGKGAGMAKSFLEMAKETNFPSANTDEINVTLVRFFETLKKVGAEFGYRSATEMLRLMNQLSVLDIKLTTHQKLDIAIMQKLLPKLHGSRRKLCPVLETLGTLCIQGDVKIITDVFENNTFDYEGAHVLYPLSLEKISRMYRSAIDNGFASFAEA